MRAEDHQNQWFSFGALLFGGGIVVSADWVFAVKSAPFDNHLSFTGWPIWLWIGMIGIGIYVMLASYIESWPLPGKERVKVAKSQRSIALGYLAAFHLVGDRLSDGGTKDAVSEWIFRLGDYVKDTWDFPEQTAIISSVEWSGAAENTARAVNERLLGLIQRSSILPIQSNFLVGPMPAWQAYIDGTLPVTP